MNEKATATFEPKLRFPEFRGAEGWKQTKLERCLDYQQPTPYLVADTKYSPTFKTPVLTAGKTFILGYTDEQHGIFSKDLPVVIFDDFTTATQFVDFPFKAKSSAMKILLAKNGTDIKFMFETLQTLKYEVGAHERHWISSFAPMLVPIPTRAEQQKIAECLSSVDEMMAAQARKVDALKTHKKGLMQQLFPREGETQPRLRFPEFQNAGEWEEDTLDDIATFRRGSFPQPYGLPEWYDEENGMPFIQVFDVGDDFRLKDRTKRRISKLGAEKSVFIPEGRLIVTLQGSIGRVAITHYDAYIDRTLLIFESFQKPIDTVFFSRVIQNLFDIEKEKAPGGIIKTITKEALSDFKVKYPALPEQQRIASCLSSLDALITAETQKLEALKTHKKGLMQQLFPSPELAEA